MRRCKASSAQDGDTQRFEEIFADVGPRCRHIVKDRVCSSPAFDLKAGVWQAAKENGSNAAGLTPGIPVHPSDRLIDDRADLRIIVYFRPCRKRLTDSR